MMKSCGISIAGYRLSESSELSYFGFQQNRPRIIQIARPQANGIIPTRRQIVMTKKNQNRREFLMTGAAGLATIGLFRNTHAEIGGLTDVDPFPELVEATIPQLQAKLKSGQLTARRLTEMYLERG